jgi:hypothetical protein
MAILLAFGRLIGVEMGGMVAGVISAVVGGVLAVALGFGLVSSQTSSPAPVDTPYIVYGTS